MLDIAKQALLCSRLLVTLSFLIVLLVKVSNL